MQWRRRQTDQTVTAQSGQGWDEGSPGALGGPWEDIRPYLGSLEGTSELKLGRMWRNKHVKEALHLLHLLIQIGCQALSLLCGREMDINSVDTPRRNLCDLSLRQGLIP